MSEAIKQRAKDWINVQLGSNLDNLKLCNELLQEWSDRKSELESTLLSVSREVPSKVSAAAVSLEEATSTIEKLSADIDSLLERIQQQTSLSQDLYLDLKEYFEQLRTLEHNLSYLQILKTVKEASDSIQSYLQSQEMGKAIFEYKLLCDTSLSLLDSKCEHLKTYTVETTKHWHRVLKSILSDEFGECMKTVHWPLTGSNLTASPSPEAVGKFQAALRRLLRVQLPRHPADTLHSAELGEEREGVSSSLQVRFPPRSLPASCLLAPLRKRFLYHFTGSRPTNRSDKPEWYFTQILSWIRDHEPFLNTWVQPVYNDLKIEKQVVVEVMSGLVELSVEKLGREVDELQYDDSLFSHPVDETLGFERELRQGHLYLKTCLVTVRVEVMSGLVELSVEKLGREVDELQYDDSLFSHPVDETLGFERELRQGHLYLKTCLVTVRVEVMSGLVELSVERLGREVDELQYDDSLFSHTVDETLGFERELRQGHLYLKTCLVTVRVEVMSGLVELSVEKLGREVDELQYDDSLFSHPVDETLGFERELRQGHLYLKTCLVTVRVEVMSGLVELSVERLGREVDELQYDDSLFSHTVDETLGFERELRQGHLYLKTCLVTVQVEVMSGLVELSVEKLGREVDELQYDDSLFSHPVDETLGFERELRQGHLYLKTCLVTVQVEVMSGLVELSVEKLGREVDELQYDDSLFSHTVDETLGFERELRQGHLYLQTCLVTVRVEVMSGLVELSVEKLGREVDELQYDDSLFSHPVDETLGFERELRQGHLYFKTCLVTVQVEVMSGLVELSVEKLGREVDELQYDDSLFSHTVDETLGFERELRQGHLYLQTCLVTVRVEVMSGLVELSVEKLGREVDELQYDDSLFSHTVDETLGFERELRQGHLYLQTCLVTVQVEVMSGLVELSVEKLGREVDELQYDDSLFSLPVDETLGFERELRQGHLYLKTCLVTVQVEVMSGLVELSVEKLGREVDELQYDDSLFSHTVDETLGFERELRQGHLYLQTCLVTVQVEVMSGLVELSVEKLGREVDELQYDDSLFSHTVDETLGFERELRQGHLYPASLPGPLHLLTQAPLFLKWIRMERKFAREKMDNMLSSETAWSSLSGLDEDRQTEVSHSFLALLATISQRYSLLPQPGHRLQFVELELELIDDLRVSLLQILHSEYSDPINSKIPAILNTVLHLKSALEQYDASPTVLLLGHYKRQTVTAGAGEEAGGGGGLFADSISLLERLQVQLTSQLAGAILLEVKARSRPYRKYRWFSLSPEDLDESTVTQEACPMFQALADSLHKLYEKLSEKNFDSLWKLVASQLNNFLLEELVLDSTFTVTGGQVLEKDVKKFLLPLFQQYSSSPISYFLQLLEACRLLSLPELSTRCQRAVLTGSSGPELCLELPFTPQQLSQPQLIAVLSHRIDISPALL